MTKLHIGCGDAILPGWINLDAIPHGRVDIVDDARTLESIPLESVDLIYAACVLEHFTRNEVSKVLETWISRLKPGGTLRLSVPDFAALAWEYNANDTPLEKLLGPLIGGQKDEYDRHGAMFDMATITQLLESVGFEDVRRYDWRETAHAKYDDFSQAYLPHMDKENGVLNSLNIEATRPRWVDNAGRSPNVCVIGDSHSWAFAGVSSHPKFFEYGEPVVSRNRVFQVNHMGPWLAWALGEEARAQEVIDTIQCRIDCRLEGSDVSSFEYIVLSFGEIDCRCHVVPRIAEKSNCLSSLDELSVGESILGRYTQFAAKLRGRFDIPVILHSAPLPTGGPIYNPEFPARGSFKDRFVIGRAFNDLMKLYCKRLGLGFIDITKDLLKGHRTRVSLYADNIHLDGVKVEQLLLDKFNETIQEKCLR